MCCFLLIPQFHNLVLPLSRPYYISYILLYLFNVQISKLNLTRSNSNKSRWNIVICCWKKTWKNLTSYLWCLALGSLQPWVVGWPWQNSVQVSLLLYVKIAPSQTLTPSSTQSFKYYSTFLSMTWEVFLYPPHPSHNFDTLLCHLEEVLRLGRKPR